MSVMLEGCTPTETCQHDHPCKATVHPLIRHPLATSGHGRHAGSDRATPISGTQLRPAAAPGCRRSQGFRGVTAAGGIQGALITHRLRRFATFRLGPEVLAVTAERPEPSSRAQISWAGFERRACANCSQARGVAGSCLVPHPVNEARSERAPTRPPAASPGPPGGLEQDRSRWFCP